MEALLLLLKSGMESRCIENCKNFWGFLKLSHPRKNFSVFFLGIFFFFSFFFDPFSGRLNSVNPGTEYLTFSKASCLPASALSIYWLEIQIHRFLFLYNVRFVWEKSKFSTSTCHPFSDRWIILRGETKESLMFHG